MEQPLAKRWFGRRLALLAASLLFASVVGATAPVSAAGSGFGPDPVTCTVATNADGSVTVTWNDANANGYSVSHDDGQDKAWIKGLSRTDATPGTVYEVVAWKDGTSETATCSVDGGPPPPPPGGPSEIACSVVDNGDGSVTVAWDDANASGYSVSHDGGQDKAWIKGLSRTDATPGTVYTVVAWKDGKSSSATCELPAGPACGVVYPVTALFQMYYGYFFLQAWMPEEDFQHASPYRINLPEVVEEARTEVPVRRMILDDWRRKGQVTRMQTQWWTTVSYNRAIELQQSRWLQDTVHVGTLDLIPVGALNRDSNIIDTVPFCMEVTEILVTRSTPISFDLNGDGQIGVTGESTARDAAPSQLGETVEFDINADGAMDQIEWLNGDGDAFLIDNADGEAATDMDGDRLFGDANGTYATGYDKLATWDTNYDGVISGDELAGLALWVDNGNAVVEAGEIRTLADYEITEISTEMTMTDGLMRSVARTAGGSVIMTEDVWFGVAAIGVATGSTGLTSVYLAIGGAIIALSVWALRRRGTKNVAVTDGLDFDDIEAALAREAREEAPIG